MSCSDLAGKRVMVCEDDLLVSMLIEDLLKDYGCIIVGPFATVSSALEAARKAEIDVALLDVNLQGAKIYPVAEVLAQKHVPVLILSGYGQDALPPDRPKWRVCGKPFNTAELVKILCELLAPRTQSA
jgi:DNA-binding response OmpR family regulator